MMNLLPYENKHVIRAGRANLLLVRYVLLTLVALVALVAIIAIAWLLLNTIKQDAQARIDESNGSSLQLASDVKKIKDFQQNLATAKDILSSEINYSTIILRYASAIPDGAIIDHIELDPSIVGTPSTFTAKVTNSAKVLQLKDALSKSPYFDDVHFTQITRSNEADTGYGYSVQISLTINKSLLESGGNK